MSIFCFVFVTIYSSLLLFQKPTNWGMIKSFLLEIFIVLNTFQPQFINLGLIVCLCCCCYRSVQRLCTSYIILYSLMFCTRLFFHSMVVSFYICLYITLLCNASVVPHRSLFHIHANHKTK